MKIALWLVIAAAVGFYLEHSTALQDSNRVADPKVLRLLREPRRLPDIEITDDEAHPLKLSSFKGKMILLNIWATWCEPCRREMPALDRLQSKISGADFTVVAVSIDSDAIQAIRAFYRQNGIKHLHMYIGQSEKVLPDLGVAAIPTTLLIDRFGNQVGYAIGPVQWDSPELVEVIRGQLVAPTKPKKISELYYYRLIRADHGTA